MLIETTLPEWVVRRLEERAGMFPNATVFVRITFRRGVPVGTHFELDEAAPVDGHA